MAAACCLEDVSLLSLLQSRRKAVSGGISCLNEVLQSSLFRRFQTQGSVSSNSPDHGSIFNIEFSPSDSIVLTACSNNSVVAYDPRLSTSKHIRSVQNAHSDCTNCITFVNDSTFLSCSDDKTIRLWDLRNLSSSLCILIGHTNWVKNIEYDKKSNKVFSVAFRDGVREWSLEDLNGGVYETSENCVFRLDDPIRMRIAPDSSKMFVSVRENRCLVIDRFEGDSIAERRTVVEKLVAESKSSSLCDQDVNRPFLLTISGLLGRKNSYRSVMSASFHPSSEMVALRHVDVKNNHLQQELSTLYNLRMPGPSSQSCTTIQNSPDRYLKYIDEYSPDEALDYIKECSFSPNGRVLASPHNSYHSPIQSHGVRLLAVDSKCTPMELYYDDRFFSSEKTARCCDYEVVCTLTGHSYPVLACAFAHHDMMLGSGSMEGHILFHKPQL